MSKLWSGRVESELAPEVTAFLKAEDAELFPYDVAGTKLHAQRLHAAGILDDGELAEVTQRLDELTPSDLEDEDEDVHTAVERLLGPLGRKIHAGRSRNDQVATAHRLYVQDACDEGAVALAGFAQAILARAETDARTPMPAYTHLQRAIPVTVGHHLLAWTEMLERDRARSPDRRSRSRSRRTRCATRSTPSPTATSSSTTSTPARCSSCTSRGSRRSSCSGRRASSRSRGCRRTRRPARR